jgi:hypothetical protein
MFLFNKIGYKRANRFCQEVGGRGKSQTMYTTCIHVSKCKNDKRKKRKCVSIHGVLFSYKKV